MFVRVWSLSYRNGGVAASYFFDRGIIPLGLGLLVLAGMEVEIGILYPFLKDIKCLKLSFGGFRHFLKRFLHATDFPMKYHPNDSIL